MTTPERPNILYIFTDQQSANAMSATGNPDLHTPAMDRLAAEGMRFDIAYCTFPVCTPSRASMFSGFWPHQCGITWNEQSMTEQARREGIGNHLAAHGYACAYAGKWHVPWCTPMEDGHGFEVLNNFDDNALVGDLVAFLERKRDKPFFAVASFDDPHSICEVANGMPLPWGPLPVPDSLEDCPPLPANFMVPPYEPEPVAAMRNTRRTPDEWRRYRYAYHRIVERVDAKIGEILAALDRLGLTDSTLVVFASDHGENQGAHRLQAKLTLNDESARVPLIVRWPDRIPAGRVDASHPVSAGLDLYPTLCACAGIPLPGERPGLSLLPMLEGHEPERWREGVITTTRANANGPHGRMVRTARHKYIAYERGEHREQLFDMLADPGEMVNLAVCNRHHAILQRHRDLLRDWCRQTGDAFGYHYTHPRVPFLVPGDEYPEDSGGLPDGMGRTHPPL
jgi:arylsulfatase A-like enzyme